MRVCIYTYICIRSGQIMHSARVLQTHQINTNITRTYRGSFAVVKIGVPRDGGPNMAVKIINKRDANFDKASLEQEIAVMKKVDHPHCIRLHEVFNEKTKMYLVLDLVTGGELFERIIARGHFAEKDAAQLLFDVLGAIGYACVCVCVCVYVYVCVCVCLYV